jgi:hypothetical protein
MLNLIRKVGLKNRSLDTMLTSNRIFSSCPAARRKPGFAEGGFIILIRLKFKETL